MTHLSTPTPMCPIARRLAALLALALVLAAPALHAQTAGAQPGPRPAVLDALADAVRVQGAPDAAGLAGAAAAVLGGETRLVAADGVAQDRFGFSVAVSGTHALVGAYGRESGRGAAYAFEFENGAWVPKNTLRPSDGAANHQFGWAVAISGDRAFVTAPGVDAAYAFVWTGAAWAQRARLVPPATLVADYGFSVAMSGDRAIVGASYSSATPGTATGAAFVYVASGSSWVLQQQQLGAGQAAPGDNFGYAVAISGDRVLVGAYRDNTERGAVVPYVFNGTFWTAQARFRGTEVTPGDRFGIAVALNGDRALVGADESGAGGNAGGAAFVYEWSGSAWVQRQRLVASDRPPTFPDRWDERFGGSVALSGDQAVVGAQYARVDPTDTSGPVERGAAYLFAYDGTWRETAKLTASDWTSNDRFGSAVAIGGEAALIGAWAKSSARGAAYVYGVGTVEPLAVTFPQTRDTLLAVGETYDITWEAPGIGQVTLTAAIRTAPSDDDFTIAITAEPVDAVLGRYTWTVPEAVTSPNVRIRVADASDPTVYAYSAQVRVREPHALVRVVEDDAGQRTYRDFKPSVHAWAFLNNEDPWWPEDVRRTDSLYYRNRTIGYDPNYEAADVRYAEALFGEAVTDWYPSWLSATDAFGLPVTYGGGLGAASSGGTLYNQATPAAVQWWMGHYGDFGGACYGMSLTTLAAFEDPERFMPIIDESGETLSEVGSVTPRVRGTVNARQLYQWDTGTVRSEVVLSATALLESLKTMFERDDAALLSRILAVDDAAGAHAVVPYRIEDNGGAGTRIYVYDPNAGGSDERFVYIDNATGGWTFLSGGSTWSSQAAATLSLTGATPTMYGPAVAPWTIGGSDLASGEERDEILVRGPSSSVTTPDGATIRYDNGVVTGQADGVRAVFERTGGPSRPVGYELAPGVAYTFGLVSEPSTLGAPSGLDVRHGSAWLGFEVPGTELAGAFTATLAPAGPLRVVNTGGAATTIALTALARADAADERSWRVEGLRTGAGVEIASEVIGGADAFRVSGPASATDYRLVVVEATADGVRTFMHAAIPMGGGSIHTIRPVWGTLDRAPVLVEVDTDGDGDPDETLMLTNEGIVDADPAPTESVSEALALAAYPNPARGHATVSVSVPSSGSVVVSVFDVLGREVALLHDGPLAAGTHPLRLDAARLPAGVYVVRASAGSAVVSQRLVVVR